MYLKGVSVGLQVTKDRKFARVLCGSCLQHVGIIGAAATL